MCLLHLYHVDMCSLGVYILPLHAVYPSVGALDLLRTSQPYVYVYVCVCAFFLCEYAYLCVYVYVCVCVFVRLCAPVALRDLVLPALVLGIFPDGVDEDCLHTAHCFGHGHPRGAVALAVIADEHDGNVWVFFEKFLDVVLLVFLVLSVVKRNRAVHAAFEVESVCPWLV